MKRLLVVLALVSLLALVIVPAAFAQDELPGTALEALEKINQWFLLGVGLLVNRITSWVRKSLPSADDKTKSKIAGLAAEAVNMIASIASTLLLYYGGIIAEYADTNDLWTVAVVVWGYSQGGYLGRKFAKGSGLAQVAQILRGGANV